MKLTKSVTHAGVYKITRKGYGYVLPNSCRNYLGTMARNRIFDAVLRDDIYINWDGREYVSFTDKNGFPVGINKVDLEYQSAIQVELFNYLCGGNSDLVTCELKILNDGKSKTLRCLEDHLLTKIEDTPWDKIKITKLKNKKDSNNFIEFVV